LPGRGRVVVASSELLRLRGVELAGSAVREIDWSFHRALALPSDQSIWAVDRVVTKSGYGTAE
jgi:hypothetical protein